MVKIKIVHENSNVGGNLSLTHTNPIHSSPSFSTQALIPSAADWIALLLCEEGFVTTTTGIRLVVLQYILAVESWDFV